MVGRWLLLEEAHVEVQGVEVAQIHLENVVTSSVRLFLEGQFDRALQGFDLVGP